MTSIEHDTDAGIADVSAGCGRIDIGDPDERVTVTCAVIGLTNFGERPSRAPAWPRCWAGR